MKIRSDFVTNSSSSSFISITINSKTLANILVKFQTEIKKGDVEYNPCNSLVIDESSVTYLQDECCYIDVEPHDVLSSITALLQALFGYAECVEIPDVDEEYNIDEINEYIEYADENIDGDGKVVSIAKQVVSEIIEHRKEIVEDTENVDYTYSDIGWGGDDDTRFYKESYSEGYLKEIYEEIAKEKGISVEEVTEEDLADYAGCKSSVSETTYVYDKKNGFSETSYDYYLD